MIHGGKHAIVQKLQSRLVGNAMSKSEGMNGEKMWDMT